MEKLSREARNDVEERMDALNLWERAVIRTQNRGEEMDALLQVIILMAIVGVIVSFKSGLIKLK